MSSDCYKAEGITCVCDKCLEEGLGIFGTVNPRHTERNFLDEVKERFGGQERRL